MVPGWSRRSGSPIPSGPACTQRTSRRAVETGLSFRPLEETIAGAANAPAEEGVGLTAEREAELLAAWQKPLTVAYPGPEGAHSARPPARLFPEARPAALPRLAPSPRPWRRARRRRRAADREHDERLRSETHDLLFDSAPRSRPSLSSRPPLPARARRRPARRAADDLVAPGRARPVPAPADAVPW